MRIKEKETSKVYELNSITKSNVKTVNFKTAKKTEALPERGFKLLIIDDHRLYADGIRTLINNYNPRISVDYTENHQSAIELFDVIESPDLILLSINHHANDNSYALIGQLQQLGLNIPVMILSAEDSPSAAGLAIEHNASGFLGKTCSRKNILEAIQTVLDGNIYIGKPKLVAIEEPQNVSTNKITKRQQQVLRLLSKGLLNKQIAWELEISENTVKAHLSDLFRHLQVSNRTAAVKYGYEYGLLM